MAARAAFDELAEHWGQRYPAIVRRWAKGWQAFIPFLEYDIEVHRVLLFTNTIESDHPWMEPDKPSIHSPDTKSINQLADTDAEIVRLTAELVSAKARCRR